MRTWSKVYTPILGEFPNIIVDLPRVQQTEEPPREVLLGDALNAAALAPYAVVVRVLGLPTSRPTVLDLSFSGDQATADSASDHPRESKFVFLSPSPVFARDQVLNPVELIFGHRLLLASLA